MVAGDLGVSQGWALVHGWEMGGTEGSNRTLPHGQCSGVDVFDAVQDLKKSTCPSCPMLEHYGGHFDQSDMPTIVEFPSYDLCHHFKSYLSNSCLVILSDYPPVLDIFGCPIALPNCHSSTYCYSTFCPIAGSPITEESEGMRPEVTAFLLYSKGQEVLDAETFDKMQQEMSTKKRKILQDVCCIENTQKIT